MKINVIFNHIPQRSETFLTSWIQQLSENGYQVRVIAIRNWYFGKSDKLKMLPNIKYHSKLNLFVLLYGSLKGLFKFNLKSGIREVLISQGDPDIIHFSYTAIGVLYINEIERLKFQNISFFVSCRGTSDNIKPYINKMRGELLKRLFQVVDRVHCVSQEMLNRMVRDFDLQSSKGFVNRPAIDITKFQNSTNIERLENKKIIILTTGRLEYVKGFIFALLAIKDLVEKGYNVEYRIVGHGSEIENLQFYCNRLNIESNVVLIGGLNHTDVIEEIRGADLYLCSSLSEGISNAVLEAMAMGVGVISTNVGGMGEVVKNGESGILIEPYESDQISSTIEKLILNNDLRIKLTNTARDLITREYSLKRLFEVFDFNYKIILK